MTTSIGRGSAVALDGALHVGQGFLQTVNSHNWCHLDPGV